MSRRSEVSAGILAFRRNASLELLLAHPGGPYWRNKHAGAWSIPKGVVKQGCSTLYSESMKQQGQKI